MNQNLIIGNRPISIIRNLAITSTFLLCCIFSSLNTFSQSYQSSYNPVTTNIYSNVGGYMESLPNDYAANPSKRYPLIIFLHGSGELGNGSASSLTILNRIGIARLLANKLFPSSFSYGGTNYSFIVVTPQMKTANDWTNSIQAVIDYCKKTYRVDENRIYLTGLSLGGVTAWEYSANSVDRGKGLAASLLVCPGAYPTSWQLSNISQSQLPIWVTNNSNDPINAASGAQELVNAINNTVPKPPTALLTIFNQSGHDAWTKTYDPAFTQNGLNVYQWMLSHSRSTGQTNTPPALTANAGANQVIMLPTNSVTLDASGSSVSSGSITSYTWTKVSGPTSGTISSPSSAKTSVTNLDAGTYTFQVSIKDSYGSTATANVTVTVNVSTDPPYVNAGIGGTITLPVNTFTLDGSTSKASAGNTIVSYKWVKTSGPAGGNITSPSNVITTVTNLQEGTYVYDLYVTDSRGASRSGGTTIYVKPAQSTASTDPPTAVPSKAGDITLPTNTYTFDASASTASSGNTIVSYLWTKRSGPAGGNITSPNSAKTTITNLQEGYYIFDIKVTDNNGRSAIHGTYIIVRAATSSTVPPTAVPSKAGDITLPTNTYTFDAYASTAAPGNTIASYLWTKRSGPAGGNISTPNSVNTTITDLQEGYYIFDITVTDNWGNSSKTGTYIIVRGAPTAKRTMAASDTTQIATNQEIRSTSALLDKFSPLSVTVSPNPVASDMNILIKGGGSGKTNIAIYNIAGKLLQQQEFNKEDSGSMNKRFNISKLPSGIYIVQVMVDGKYRQVTRVVKQ
ncbi:MAG: T9SS type A sorting domain-containing protein [Bacteroidetes bacterium]|nr:T9SS type A sorting domain-containing protein [Bacteroidota bacterium]